MPFPSSGADDAFDYLFKIILIGDSNVGKTCVVHRFKTGQFNEKQQNTIGVDFTVRSMDIDGKKVKVGGGSEPEAPGELRLGRAVLPVPVPGSGGTPGTSCSALPKAAGKSRLSLTGGVSQWSFLSWICPGGSSHPNLGTYLLS